MSSEQNSQSSYRIPNKKKERRSNRSIDMLNKRPKRDPNMFKSNRTSSKNSHKSLNKQMSSQNHMMQEMYYPGVSLCPIKSQKSAPVSNYADNYKKINSTSSKKHMQKQLKTNVGQSFVSFNAVNSSVRNNTNAIQPSNKLIENDNFSGNLTDNANKARESFESCTTQGKNKTGETPEIHSSNKLPEINENAYSSIQNPNKSSKASRSQGNRSKSCVSQGRSETIGENSLPEISNSVVEDSLPFKGLENHYKVISKEGFSGANNANSMKKTNENFYSSFKSKRNDTPSITYAASNPEDGQSYTNKQQINQTDVNNEENNSSQKQNMYNVIKASSHHPKPKSTITVKKNSKNNKMSKKRKANRSKASNRSNDSEYFSNELTSKYAKNISKTKKIASQKFNELDSDIERLQQNEQIFSSNQVMEQMTDDVNKTYDQLKSFRKQNNKPNINDNGASKNKKWENVAKFLETNNDAIFNKPQIENNINSDKDLTHIPSERSHYGINNFRMFTGISAPGRQNRSSKRSNDVIAPWKIGKKQKVSNTHYSMANHRMQNISSKVRQNLPTNASNNDISNASKPANKSKVHIPVVSNKDGIENYKETVNFESSNNDSAFYESSMLEKRTIIFESDFEKSDHQSEAPTESQYIERKNTINFDDSSYMGGENQKELIRQDTENRTSSRVDSEKPGAFNVNSSKNLATFRDNKIKSHKDIPFEQQNLEDYYDNGRDAKTALNHTRMAANASRVTVNHIEQMNNDYQMKANSISLPQAPDAESSVGQPQNGDYDKVVRNQLINQNIQVNPASDISPSEKNGQKNEIYLNTNFDEQNPHLIDRNIKDSYSVSKYTLEVNTHTELEEEGESQLSQKEMVPKPAMVDLNLQVAMSDDTSEGHLTDKNLQVSSHGAPTRNVEVFQDTSDFTDGQSEYINREVQKLQCNNCRREKVTVQMQTSDKSIKGNQTQSSKRGIRNQQMQTSNKSLKKEQMTSTNKVPLLKIPKPEPNKKVVSNSQSRYSKKPFVYNPKPPVMKLGNADSISQLSRERKMDDRPNMTRGGERRVDAGTNILPEFGRENKSMEYVPPVTPPMFSKGIQPSDFDRSAGIQMSSHDRSAGVQAAPNDRSAGVQMSYDDKSAGIQVSQLNRSAGMQVSQPDHSASAQVGKSLLGSQSNIEYDDKSCQFKPSRSQGVQFDEKLKNKCFQADEQPLKDMDVQCDMSEFDKGIQAEAPLVDRSISADSQSLRNPLMARELHIVDKQSDSFVNDDLIDFS